jgi:excisionase family DNA binding protein
MAHSKKATVAEQLPVDPNVKWLTVEEASRYLRVSAQYVRRILHGGELKAAGLGGSAGFRIDRVDLDQLMLRRKRTVPPYRKGSHPWVAARHDANRQKRAAR